MSQSRPSNISEDLDRPPALPTVDILQKQAISACEQALCQLTVYIKFQNTSVRKVQKQAISASERALCQLTVYFEFQSRSERRKDSKVVPCKWYSEVK